MGQPSVPTMRDRRQPSETALKRNHSQRQPPAPVIRNVNRLADGFHASGEGSKIAEEPADLTFQTTKADELMN